MNDDIDLLRAYAQRGSQEAFSQLVTRHLPLVHGVARRQVRSPDLANEVAQTVFLELAGAARRLRPDTCLASWLFVATRRKAIDVIRKQTTREKHEQAAVIMSDKTSAPWAELEPLLDAAMDSLGDDDRRAILLRFFENQSLADVGRALRCSEDAAQKRVIRALDRLRDFLARRGVATVASALAADITAFAAPPVPIGLGSTIARSLPSGTSVVGATRSLLPALQKIVGVAACAGAIGFAAYEGWVLQHQQTDLRNLATVAAKWRADAADLQRARERRQAEMALAAAASTPSAPASADPDFDARIREVLTRIAQVKQRFLQNPTLAIPELALLSDSDWFGVVQEQRAWGTDQDWRQVLANVRTRAINRATSPMQAALRRYVQENSGMLPTETAQLAPYLPKSLDPAILARYEMKASGVAEEVSPNTTVIQGRRDNVIDPQYDGIGILGMRMSGIRAAQIFGSSPDGAELESAMEAAITAYRAAHGGKDPDSPDPAVLVPFFSDPVKGASFLQQATLRTGSIGYSESNAVGHAMNLYHAANHGQYAASPKDLAPYFQNPADAARYLKAVEGQVQP